MDFMDERSQRARKVFWGVQKKIGAPYRDMTQVGWRVPENNFSI